MNIFSNIATSVVSNALGKRIANNIGKTNTTIKVNAPELYLAGGIALGVAGAIMLARAYKRHDEVMAESKAELEYVNTASGEVIAAGESSVDEVAQSLVSAYGTYAWNLCTLYGPSIATGALAIAMVVQGHRVLRGRNKAILAALLLFEKAFDQYRKRVADRYGEEVEEGLYYGTDEQSITTIEKGKDGKKKKKKTVKNVLPENYDPALYSRIFDKWSPDYGANKEMNRFYLAAKESYYNDILQIKGHVLLNDVYDSMRIDRTAEGAVVGWSLLCDGDNYISFGLDAPVNSDETDPRYLMDFNVNGVILEYL